MLRVDSITFIVGGLVLALCLRFLRRPLGGAVYAAAGLLWFLGGSGWRALPAALAFVYLPLAVIRLMGRPLRWIIPGLLFSQIGFTIWVRGDFGRLPWIGPWPFWHHSLQVIGISYIILRQVQWLLLVEVDEAARDASFLEYTGYLLGPFTLLAGPIFSWEEYRDAIREPAPALSADGLLQALDRIVNGYIKLLLIGPVLHSLTALEFLEATQYSRAALLLFVYLWPLYLYFNFAGYCDVVIGFGQLGGLVIPENFDRPFVSLDVQEYWQRWHITLSTWTRSFVFNPVFRSLRSGAFSAPTWAALFCAGFASFMFIGLWHGSSPGDLLFGVTHGIAVPLVTLSKDHLKRYLGQTAYARYDANRAMRVLRRLAFYHFLCATLILFDRDPVKVYSAIKQTFFVAH